MTAAQQKWMDDHPGYEGMSSWRGPYKGSGILSPKGRLTAGCPLEAFGPDCLHVGERVPAFSSDNKGDKQ